MMVQNDHFSFEKTVQRVNYIFELAYPLYNKSFIGASETWSDAPDASAPSELFSSTVLYLRPCVCVFGLLATLCYKAMSFDAYM